MSSRFNAIGVRALAMAGTFFQVVVVSRTLDLEDAGLVFLLFTLMTLGATVGRFGTDNLVMRKIAARQTGHEWEARWLLIACWLTSCMSGALLFWAIWSGVLPFADRGIGAPEAAVVGLMTVVYALGVFAGAVLRGAGRLVAGILAELGIAPWLTILGLWLLPLFGEPTVLGVLAVQLVSGAITAAWALWAARTSLARAALQDWREGLAFLRTQSSSLGHLMGTSVLFFALVWAPQLALGLVGTGAQVAQYTVAARIASFISLFPGIQTSYLGPKFAALAASDSRSELSRLCGGAATAAMVVAVPLLVFISESPYFVLSLFGEGYEAAAIPALVLSIGAYIVLAFGQVNTVMLTAGLERTALLLNALLLLVVAAISLLGVPYIGVTGVSIVSATASLLYAVAAALVIQSSMKVDATLISYFKQLAVGAPRMRKPMNG